MTSSTGSDTGPAAGPAPAAPAARVEGVGELTGCTVIGGDGVTLGRLEHVYRAKATDEPRWGVVGSVHGPRFVPLGGLLRHGRVLQVPVAAPQVAAAPVLPIGDELDPAAEDRLTQHYRARTPPTPPAAAASSTASAPRVSPRSGAAAPDDPQRAQPTRIAAPAVAPGGATAGATREGEAGPLGSVAAGRSAARMRRSRGAVSAVLLVGLGGWGALVPFLGPLFGYAFGSYQPWAYSPDRGWLDVAPGLAVVLGGFILGPTGSRITAAGGAGLALLGGIWFTIGPTVSRLWGAPGPQAPIGVPLGSTGWIVLEQLGYFPGLGALITTIAALALGRITIRSHRDMI